MSASLVGSEMCIRDRPSASCGKACRVVLATSATTPACSAEEVPGGLSRHLADGARDAAPRC
eukprot:6754716-Alexandrium_andersonii.AAC.1